MLSVVHLSCTQWPVQRAVWSVAFVGRVFAAFRPSAGVGATVWRGPATCRASRMQASLQQGALAPSQAYGYKVGDLVFYMGQSQTFADGDKVAHGQQGNVIGVLPTQISSVPTHLAVISSVPTHLAVRFSGNKGYVGLRFNEVPPPPRRLRCHSQRAPPQLRCAAPRVRRSAAFRRHRYMVATRWARSCSTRGQAGRLSTTAQPTSSCKASRAR